MYTTLLLEWVWSVYMAKAGLSSTCLFQWLFSSQLWPGARAYSYAFFGRGIGPIHLTNARCTGTESTLFSCRYSLASIFYCGHYEDAGVRCQGNSVCVLLNTHIVCLSSAVNVTLKIMLNTRSMPEWVSSCGECTWNNIKAGQCGALYLWQVEDYVYQLLGQQRCFCCVQTNWILTTW